MHFVGKYLSAKGQELQSFGLSANDPMNYFKLFQTLKDQLKKNALSSFANMSLGKSEFTVLLNCVLAVVWLLS